MKGDRERGERCHLVRYRRRKPFLYYKPSPLTFRKNSSPFVLLSTFCNFAEYFGEVTPSRQKKERFLCFALDFS